MINLREACKCDLPIMLAWRSNKEVYKGFYQQKGALVWEEHLKWFNSRNQDWRTLLVLYQDRPVGVVTIGQLDNWNPEIGYYIGEVSLWGKGVGTEAVRQGIEWVKEYAKTHSYITSVHTTILYSNKASIKLIEKLGFKHVCEARKGEGRWEMMLNQSQS